MNAIWFLSVLLVLVLNDEVKSSSCQLPLGMQDGRIQNKQITAQGSGAGTKGFNARIGHKKGWCSRRSRNLSSNIDPQTYLLIDLLKLHKITKLSIAGATSQMQYKPARSAKLSFKINEAGNYTKSTFIMLDGVHLSNIYTITLKSPMVARYLKYQPKIDENPRCLTMELYGCPLMKSNCQADILRADMDYLASSNNPSLLPRHISSKLHRHRPWGPNRNVAPYSEYVTIDLKNDYLITGVSTVSPMYFRSPKRQPESFLILYKTGGSIWFPYIAASKHAFKFNTTTTLRETVEMVSPLAASKLRIYPKEGKGRFLNMHIFGCLLADPNIFKIAKPTLSPLTSPLTSRPKTSQTKSTSMYTSKPFTTPGTSTYPTPFPSSTSIKPTSKYRGAPDPRRKQIPPRKVPSSTSVKPTSKYRGASDPRSKKIPPRKAGKQNSRSNSTLIVVIVLILVALVTIFVTATVFLHRWRKKILWKKDQCRQNQRGGNTKGDRNDVENSGLLNNVTLNPIYEVTTWQNDENTCSHTKMRGGKVVGNEEQHKIGPYCSKDVTVDHELNYDSVYANRFGKGCTKASVQMNRLPIYAEPDAENQNVELNPIYCGFQGGKDALLYEKLKSLDEVAKIYEDPHQCLYADPNIAKEQALSDVRKFPRDKLLFLEKVGTGQFGEVHICEVESTSSVMGSDAEQCSGIMSSKIKVAVKMLILDVERNVETEFMKEVSVMARLQHDNVVQLLGICDEEPKFMVVEYMENGDLNQFLQSYTLTDGLSDATAQVLNVQTLLYICLQISAGMDYLSMEAFVHRDLATRNCLVGHSFTVKISDFGMSRHLYSKQYYRIEGRAVLPIRWMAPESLFYDPYLNLLLKKLGPMSVIFAKLGGVFTSESDVWAFAVTLWEIFTFAKETPYKWMTDQHVIENACSVVAEEKKAFKCLSKPQPCPENVYELLLCCWKRSPSERPNFKDLNQFFVQLGSSAEASI